MVLDRPLVLPKISIGNTPVEAVGFRIAWAEPNCLVTVLDRSLMLLKTAIRNAPIDVGLSVARV